MLFSAYRKSYLWQSKSITCNSKEDVGKVRPEKNMIQEEWMKFEKTKQFSFAKFKWHWKSKTTQFLFIQFPKKIAKSNGVTL